MRARHAAIALVVGIVLLAVALVAPRPASAHPLGNATINHFDRITVSAEAITVLHVVDVAEIPTVSARQDMDADDDGIVAAAESAAYLAGVVPDIVGSLELVIDGEAVGLEPAGAARLSFPAGQAGLPTMRIELDLTATLPTQAVRDGVDVTFRDEGEPDRIGWREVIALAGAGATITSSTVGAVSTSDELRAYPADGLDDPIDVREVSFHAELGEATASASSGDPSGSESIAGDPIAGLLGGANGGPIAAVVAVLVSIGLGAAHAASPGHGKTLMAAYLIGSRGSASQALALAGTVAVTHTIGVFVLGLIVFGASDVLLPERVVDWLGLAAGVIVLAMGIRLAIRLVRPRHDHAHDHGHPHPHADGGHGHSHGGDRLSGRSVAVIGLAGGMVPSTSALIVLLVGVNQGQLALGVALVVAFGAGMAIVLGGVGLAVVLGRRMIGVSGGRIGAHPLAGRVAGMIPAASALTVLAIGIVLAIGAVSRIA